MANQGIIENKLFLRIITPEGSFFEQSVDFLTLNLAEGEATILPKKSHLISYISPCVIKICVDKAKEKYENAIAIGGIFSSINSTTEIISKDIKWEKDIKIEKLKDEIKYWESRMNKLANKNDPYEIENSKKEIKRCETLIDLKQTISSDLKIK